ncbi:MAG: hypothetical protein COB36_03320 [Alphaproteobacteria bacterium]|nr:MAG: hypothetical protein COB36_03320 [Alphaproteobacteria bacterium]
MLVSIILNNYNYDAYLSQAIDSALGQTYNSVEVIVVDDGSTDNSKNIIMGYGDKIRAFFKDNGGQVSAMNMGWEKANGDIIIFLDSDDVLSPDTAKQCVKAFEGSDYVSVYYMLKRVDGDMNPLGGVIPTYGYQETPALEDIKLWGYYICPPTSGLAFRKDFLKNIMPAPDSLDEYGYDLPVDGYVSMLAGITGKTFFIPEILGYYRIHGKNVSNAGDSFSKEKLRRLFMVNYIREEYGRDFAKQRGIELKKDRSIYHPTVLKYRLLAFRLYPDGHPIPEDTLFNLLRRGLRGAIIFPYLSIRKRLIIFGGLLLVSILPKFVLKPFVQIISAQDKKSVLRSIMKLNKKEKV